MYDAIEAERFDLKIASFAWTRGLKREELLDVARRHLDDLRGELFAFGRAHKLSTRTMHKLTGIPHCTIARTLKRHDARLATRSALAAATKEGPERVERTVVDFEGEVQTVKMNLTPIDRLVKRGIMPSGAGLASRAYHVDFMRAGEAGRQKSQLGRFSGKTGIPDPERQEAARMDAQQRLDALRERLNGRQWSILNHVAGCERALDEWVFNEGIPKPVAVGILYSALETTAAAYGLRWARVKAKAAA
jgi:hypothetical protein